MSLKKIRESKNITRKELAEMVGVSYRSIQDYEQGHKKLSCAKATTLYKFSLALGCSIEDLIEDDIITVNEKAEHNQYSELTEDEIERENIFLNNRKINAQWKFIDNACYIEFVYKGNIVMLPFNAVFTKETLKWLKDGAELVIDEYIENIEFNEKFKDIGEVLWNEQ